MGRRCRWNAALSPIPRNGEITNRKACMRSERDGADVAPGRSHRKLVATAWGFPPGVINGINGRAVGKRKALADRRAAEDVISKQGSARKPG